MVKTDDNLIHVLGQKLALYQAPDGFRTSMDSVMLGAACPIKPGQSILDLGCGVGSAGLCALYRVEDTTLNGVDVQPCHVDIATKNAAQNDMSKRAQFVCADIRETLDLPTYHHVICNPPYYEYGMHIHSPSDAKAKAMGHTEGDISLQSWVTRAWHHIKGQGSLTMIHDAGQTDALLHALYSHNGGRRFGNVEIIPLYPRTNTPAKRVIIRAYKHKKSPAILHQGIIMHDENGDYTKAAENILRNVYSLL
ncbi:MAG: tRNA1(Val) (adenine(37)-N6)-methyltransferase [Alphaproteobacteria bacterium]